MHEWREGESFIQSFTLLGNDEIAPITIIASNPCQEFYKRITCMDVEQLLIEKGDSHKYIGYKHSNKYWTLFCEKEVREDDNGRD